MEEISDMSIEWQLASVMRFSPNIMVAGNKPLVQNLLWDLEVTRVADWMWERAAVTGGHENVLSVFVSTNAGLTRLYPSRHVCFCSLLSVSK